VKVTLKEACPDEPAIPTSFAMTAKKTIVHRDMSQQAAAGGGKAKGEGPHIPINCVTFN
jgi:hypothetical protein